MNMGVLDPPSADVHGQYRLTIPLLVRASMALSQHSTSSVAMGSWAVIMGGISTLENPLWGAAFAIFGVAVASGAYCIPFLMLSVRRRPDLLAMESEVTADESGVRFRSPIAMSQHAWIAFRRCRDLGPFFFLDYGTNVNVVVPKAGFEPGEGDRFAALAATAGKLERSHGWREPAIGIAIGVAAALAFVVAIMVVSGVLA